MQYLSISKEIEESTATEAIFDGCRANPDREMKHVKYGMYVTFKKCADGTHEVYLKNCDGYLLAVANVDEFDC